MDQIDFLLTRGVDKIYPSREELEKVLRSGKKLRLFQGFDPSGDRLHIGHMVGFRKHRQWQDLGHEVIFLIGDGTGQAGDPSGKNKTREKFFTQAELRANAVNYIKQASKIINFDGPNPVKVLYNGDWLNKLTLIDILNIAQHFTVQQLIERDMFQERLKNNVPINLREFLYPLLQGYDSVAMEVDLELGGSDQTFNMLAGRSLLKAMKNKDKFVMTTPLLSDSKGIKIGKSEGNVIGLTDTPNDLFGKLMSLGDDSIVPTLTLLTDMPQEEIDKIKVKIKSGENPMQFKKLLAKMIVTQLNDAASADTAQEYFETTFQQKQTPQDIVTVTVHSDKILDVLIETKLASSKSEAKRLIEQHGVRINDQVISNFQFPISNLDVINVGARKFVKIIYA